MLEAVSPSPGRLTVRSALVVLNAVVIAIGALGLWWTWSRSVEEATRQTVSTATLLERGASAVFDRAALALALTAETVRRQAAGGSLSAANWSGVALPHRQAREIQQIDLFDEWGDLVCGTPPCTAFSIADRAYFRQLRDTVETSPTLQGPLRSRRDGREVLVMALALRDERGTFLGMASALLPIERLRVLAGTAHLGPGGVATLRRDDGRLIVRVSARGGTEGQAVDAQLPQALRAQVAAQPSGGVLTTHSAIDGQARVSAYRRLENYPVYVIVGTAHEDIADGWKRMLPWVVALTTLLMLASVAIDRSLAQKRRAHARSRELYETAPCGYHTLDERGRYRTINATELAWIGATREQVIGKLGPADFMAEPHRLAFPARYAAFMDRGSVRDAEFDLMGPDGTRRRVSISATVVRDRDGRFVMSHSVMHDITALHEARQQLSRQSAEQRAMLESDVVGMLLERDGHIVWRNEAMGRLFGHPAAQWPQLRLCDLMRDASVLLAWEGADDTGQGASPADTRMKALCEFRRADGGTFSGELSRLKLSAQQSFVVISDVTYMRQAEEVRLAAARLESQNLALRDTARLKDAFIGSMSHELRTPLNGILGFAHLLAEGDETRTADETRRFAGRIVDCGNHLLALVENMLAVARHHAGTHAFTVADVAARQALDEVVEMLASKIEAACVVVEVVVDAGAERVATDPLRLRQILLNLMDNAIKFSHAGGRVRLRAWRATDSHWSVSVEDHGIGISEGDLAGLFQPFTQLSSGVRKRHGGLGIGLSLSRELARAQGGEIAVQSVLGRGSTFHLTLPDAGETPGAAAGGQGVRRTFIPL